MLVTLMLLHFAAFAQAQSPYGLVSMATGRAGVAGNDVGEQVIMNPAAMAHAKSLAVGYFYRAGYTEESERNQIIGLSVMDNTDDIAFSGGFLYTQEQQSFKTGMDYKSRRIQFSGANFLAQQISLGFSVYRYDIELNNGDKYNKFDYNLAMLWNPTPVFAFGAHFENLAPRDKDFLDAFEPLDQYTVGVNYIFMPQFRVRADVHQFLQTNPDNKKDYRVGLESLIDAYMMIRVGYEEATLEDRKYLSAGIGFTGPRLQIDYSYRANMDYSSGALHGVDFRLPF